MPVSHPPTHRIFPFFLLLLAVLCACAVSAPSLWADDQPASKPYPKLPTTLLNAEEQSRFSKLAQSELCPCEGSLDSLDACLQRDNGGCRLALQIAKSTMRRIKEGESDSDIVDAIVKEVELARKVYTFDLKNTPHKGADPSSAKITIVEYADFQCPYCARAADTMKSLLKEHGSQLTVYFKQYPLKMHDHARLAAQATLAAHRQNKFWELHDTLMEKQSEISPENIQTWAKDLGLDMPRFNKDLSEVDPLVAADLSEGDSFDLTGTPTIFINGIRFEGSLEELTETINERLKE